MHRLNPKTPKHKECLELTHFSHDTTIAWFDFNKTPCQEFKEATQARVAEDVMSTVFFQFQGGNDVNMVLSISHCNNFNKVCSTFKKSQKNNVIFCLSRPMASTFPPV